MKITLKKTAIVIILSNTPLNWLGVNKNMMAYEKNLVQTTY
jgi:hypothetical protein